ncbi:hypothetical protein CC78DRAFT_576822 [Lojkania enalia]|uniref:Uncharacterized protein n=1 Tax=Lojkania enalia TaxID=147567 RepID=A0A9P4KFN7_9PLEO|nr:hypothetical protein CC78DRAFT_576822 [Didymosphaeria enalia]
MGVFGSSRSTTIAKMNATYGRTGTEAEYRDPSNFQPRSAHDADDGEALRDKVKKNIVEKWWDDLCKSANLERLSGMLFDRYLFNNGIMYMYIRVKYREETLNEWMVRWPIHQDFGPFINVTNKQLEKAFDMSPPKTNFYDHSGELEKLRKLQDEGEEFRVPDDKQKYVLDEKSAEAAREKSSVSSTEKGTGDIPSRCSEDKSVPVSTTMKAINEHTSLFSIMLPSPTLSFKRDSELDMENVSLKTTKKARPEDMDEPHIDCADRDDAMDVEEVKEYAEQNEGYVYSMARSRVEGAGPGEPRYPVDALRRLARRDDS